MQCLRTGSLDPLHLMTYPSAPSVIPWVKVTEDVPTPGEIVPVWDEQYLYYAVYWPRDDGGHLWVISEQMGVRLEDIDQRRKVGEHIYPTSWMRIRPPERV